MILKSESRSNHVFPNNVIVAKDYIHIFDGGGGLNNNKVFLIHDLQGNFINSYHETDDLERRKMILFGCKSTFNLSNGNIFFNYPLCDTIYEIREQKLIPAFYFDFGGKKFSKDMFKFQNIDDLEVFDILTEIKENQGISSIEYYSVTQRFLHFSLDDFEHNGYIGFFNIINKHTIIGHHIIDDMYFTGNKYSPKAWELPTKGTIEEDLIWQIEAGFLKSAYESYKKRTPKEKWDMFLLEYHDAVDALENLDEEDNPVLMRVKVKLK